MEVKSIKIIEKDGQPVTQIIEVDGSAESVRFYADPAEAISYATGRVAYYKQPQVAAESVGKGREVVEEDGSKSRVFGSFQELIVHLGGSESKADEPAAEAPPAAPKPDEVEAGAEGEEGKPEGEPKALPAPAPEPATPPAEEPEAPPAAA